MDAATDTPKPTGEEVAPGVFLPREALRFSYARSSGPGGQNVNKLSTKVRLHVTLADLEPALGLPAVRRLVESAGPARLTAAGELVLAADASRSQAANRRACLDRLRELIVAAGFTPRTRRRTRPSAGSRQRRLEAKKQRSGIKRTRSERPQE